MYRPCQVRGRRITQLPKTGYDGNIVQRDSSKSVHIFTEHVVTLISNLTLSLPSVKVSNGHVWLSIFIRRCGTTT